MENIEIRRIIEQFDDYVKHCINTSSVKAENQLNTQIDVESQIEVYFRNLTKKLKIHSTTHAEKFQEMLNPLKKLQSFISVKDFLTKLAEEGTLASLPEQEEIKQKDNEKQQLCFQEDKQKLKMIELLQRSSQFLQSKKLTRDVSKHTFMRTTFQANSSPKSSYEKWVEDALVKINTKEKKSNFFNKVHNYLLSGSQKCYQEVNKQAIISTKKKLNTQNFTKRQENFSKVSSILTGRLRNLLKKQYTQHQNKSIFSKCKERVNWKGFSKNNQKKGNLLKKSRVQTARISTRNEFERQKQMQERHQQFVGWKKDMNSKMANILMRANI